MAASRVVDVAVRVRLPTAVAFGTVLVHTCLGESCKVCERGMDNSNKAGPLQGTVQGLEAVFEAGDVVMLWRRGGGEVRPQFPIFNKRRHRRRLRDSAQHLCAVVYSYRFTIPSVFH